MVSAIGIVPIALDLLWRDENVLPVLPAPRVDVATDDWRMPSPHNGYAVGRASQRRSGTRAQAADHSMLSHLVAIASDSAFSLLALLGRGSLARSHAPSNSKVSAGAVVSHSRCGTVAGSLSLEP